MSRSTIHPLDACANESLSNPSAKRNPKAVKLNSKDAKANSKTPKASSVGVKAKGALVLTQPETWPMSMRRCLLPRPAWCTSAPQVDAHATWRKLRGRAKSSTARHRPEVQPALQRLACEACPGPASLEVELGLALLCLSRPNQPQSPLELDADLTLLIDHWATHGAEHLLRCGLALLGCEATTSLGRLVVHWNWFRQWRRMAEHLAPLHPSERARLAAMVRGNEFAWAIFPETGEADAAVHHGSLYLRALAGVTQVAALKGLVPTHARQFSLSGWDEHYSPLPMLLTWLAALGDEVLPFLDAALDRLLAVSVDEPEIRRDVAHVLGFIATPRALDLLCLHAEDRVFAAVLCESAIAAPARAVKALAEGARKAGPVGDHCRTILRQVARRSPALAQLRPADAARVEALIAAPSHTVCAAHSAALPGWLESPKLAWLSPALPVFANPASLPALIVEATGKALPDHVVTNVLRMLAHAPVRASRASAPSDDLICLKEMLTSASMGAFALALFRAWLVAGGAPNDAWCFLAMGCLGDDTCVREIAPLVLAWPSDGLVERAEAGLAVLQGIGTDEALMHLHRVAQRSQLKSLQRRARYLIGMVAKARGFSTDELADRLVPDLGLDANGTLTLDVGSRRWVVSFDGALMPILCEGDVVLNDLPKPRKDDDRLKSRAAHTRWKALRAESHAIADQQVLRLELAMCARRRWRADVFRRCFVEHPLMQHLARRLAWGTYDNNGARIALFGVAADGTFTSANGEAFALAPNATVGVAHRLEMGAEEVAQLARTFSERALTQPFAQLDRQTFGLTSAEATESRIMRWSTPVSTSALMRLDTRGWRRERPSDAGVVRVLEKESDADTLMIVMEPGFDVASKPEPDSMQRIRSVGTRAGRLAQLHPILLSELIRDLNLLIS